MEPPDWESLNLTAAGSSAATRPLCTAWSSDPQGAVFHLSHILLFLGLMGGSGSYGLLYLFALLTSSFLCQAVWARSEPCTAEPLLWNLAHFAVCLAQLALAARRLRTSASLERDFHELYRRRFQRLGVPPALFAKLAACCDDGVRTAAPHHYLAVEGRTPIDHLSLLLAGRVRVTVNGEFLHYIEPFQFLDSPEWDSLRPCEESVFQVSLQADLPCRFVAWRRKKLYLFFAKHRYLATIFALIVRSDIADKLYSLGGGGAGAGPRHRDLRLPR